MSKKIRFEYTWCDYLTKCKYMKDIEVGSYECSKCPHHKSFELDEKSNVDFTIPESNRYNKYFTVSTGTVLCDFS